MTPAKLPQQRLYNQRLTATPLDTPADVVRWLGAVQAQDYLGSLWAIGVRSRHATEATIERAIADRSIVRTWPMRGTLHFVAAEDVRWMLELLTPRVLAAASGRLSDLGLDRRALARSAAAVSRALEGGRRLTRDALYRVLQDVRISTAGGRGSHIVWSLAHDGLICFGPREGKQQTFVLLEEWIPGARRLPREEALGELTRRYFTSHGPATAHDFAWWSGLRLSEVAEALALASAHLVSFQVGGRNHWAATSALESNGRAPGALLLPPFDEFTVAYKDRSAVLSSANRGRIQGMALLGPTMVVNGRVAGFWSRRLAAGSMKIELQPFARLTPTARRAVSSAMQRYAAFVTGIG